MRSPCEGEGARYAEFGTESFPTWNICNSITSKSTTNVDKKALRGFEKDEGQVRQCKSMIKN